MVSIPLEDAQRVEILLKVCNNTWRDCFFRTIGTMASLFLQCGFCKEYLVALSISEKLGYIGLVPFVAGAVAVVFGADGAEELFKLYPLLVLTFMSGGCWV